MRYTRRPERTPRGAATHSVFRPCSWSMRWVKMLVLCVAALAVLGGFSALFSFFYDVHIVRRSVHTRTVLSSLSSPSQNADVEPSSFSLNSDSGIDSVSSRAALPPLHSPAEESFSSFGAGRAIADLQLTRARCGFLHLPKPPQLDKPCKTSATCALGRFCHPERKICGDFCQPVPRGYRPKPQNLTPRPKDVWLVSYPKSGSTWLRHLIWNLHRFNTQREATQAVSSFTEADRPSTFAEVDKGIPFLEDRATGPIRKIFRNKKGLRVFKSHQPYSCDVSPCRGWVASRQARWQCECPNCASKFRRVIYIVRDGRPVMASYWKFQGELHLRGHRKNFGDFLSLKQRRYPGVSWSDHVLSWMSAPTGQNLDILWVRYEDMRSDTAAVLRRVGKWLHVAHDETAIAWAVHASTAQSMAATENESGPGIFAKKYKKRDSSFRMVHLTATDGQSPAHKIPWRSHFIHLMTTPRNENPVKNKAVFETDHKYMLECLGYSLDLSD